MNGKLSNGLPPLAAAGNRIVNATTGAPFCCAG